MELGELLNGASVAQQREQHHQKPQEGKENPIIAMKWDFPAGKNKPKSHFSRKSPASPSVKLLLQLGAPAVAMGVPGLWCPLGSPAQGAGSRKTREGERCHSESFFLYFDTFKNISNLLSGKRAKRRAAPKVVTCSPPRSSRGPPKHHGGAQGYFGLPSPLQSWGQGERQGRQSQLWGPFQQCQCQ